MEESIDLTKLGFGTTRRSFNRRLVELASTIPLAFLAVRSFVKDNNYFGVQVGTTDPRAIRELEELKVIPERFISSISALYSEYRREYLDTRLEMYTTTDAKGRVQTRYRTVQEWNVPIGLPGHWEVSNMSNLPSKLERKCEELSNSRVLPAEFPESSVSITEEEANRTVQSLLGIGLYSAEVGLLLGYEEIAALLGYSGRRASLNEKVEVMNTQKQMDRRGFLKILGAGVGAAAGLKHTLDDENREDEKFQELDSKIADSLGIYEASPDEGFTTYFGIAPQEIIENLDSDISKLEGSVDKVKDPGVRNAMAYTIDAGREYHNGLLQIFADGVPEDLGKLAIAGHATRELERISREQNASQSKGLLKEAGITAALMAAVVGAGEIWNYKTRE